MKKLNFSLLLISLFLVGNTFKLWTQIPDIDGLGTANEPILVNWANGTTPLQKLNKIANWVNKTGDWDGTWTSHAKHFKLDADIATFTNVIGTDASPFRGTFDGNGHRIDVYIYKPTQNRIALFGRADNAYITRLTVTGYVRGAYDVGGLLLVLM